MGQKKWTEVERYINGLFVQPDAVLEEALRSSSVAGLPSINVTPNQGKFLFLLARSVSAKSILEIGTLGGYSTIWLARALPPAGRMFSLEVHPKHAKVASDNIEKAGLGGVVEVRLGQALDTLPRLKKEGHGPFDLVFIDADKPNNPHYFEWALKLSHRGTLIIVDNVVREGEVVDAKSRDPAVEGTRSLNEAMASDPRVSVTEIQTVDSKGYDGFALALVL